MVEPAKQIEEGKHTGMISDITFREQPFKYTDFTIEFEQGKKLKYGVPTTLNTDSKLGSLLELFGIDLVVGKQVDLSELIGRPCTFMTMNKISDRGTFANVVQGSLKPVKQ